MVEINYTGKPVFFATPNLSNLKMKCRKIDFDHDTSLGPITKIHPSLYENGQCFYENAAIGVIHFPKKIDNVSIFGLSLVEDDKGATEFRTKGVPYAGYPSVTYFGGGIYSCQHLGEIKNAIYMKTTLEYGESVSKNLMGFAFGAIPTDMITNNWLPFLDTWFRDEQDLQQSNNCTCSVDIIIQSGCQCGGA